MRTNIGTFTSGPDQDFKVVAESNCKETARLWEPAKSLSTPHLQIEKDVGSITKNDLPVGLLIVRV